MRRRALAVGSALALGGCSLDTEQAAPEAEPPRVVGACGTTETLFRGLFELSREGGLDDLRALLEAHSAEGPDHRQPEASLRQVLGASIRVVTRLGIRATREAAISLGEGPVAETLSSLVLEVLRLAAGRIDGQTRYPATQAAAFFLRRCDAEPLLTLAERGLRLTRAEVPERWVLAFLRDSAALIADPEFDRFLAEFEASGARGRAAVVGVLNQIVGFLADEDFDVARVRALLEGSVYPLVQPGLASRIDQLLARVEEALTLDDALQLAAQRVARCALVDEPARREVLGFLYDLSATDALELRRLFEEVSAVAADEAQAAFLDHVAGLAVAIRDEREARRDIFLLAARFLEAPEVEKALPLFIELFERSLVSELFAGVATLLGGCEAEGRR